MAASTDNALITYRHDFVPAQDEISQSGNKNAIRSGRKPLPMPSTTAPMYAKYFSPVQQRQQQYAVARENNARFGRSGPSRLDCQNGGFTRSRNAAAAPAHRENIRAPRANAAQSESAATIMETTTNVRSGSRKNVFKNRADRTKNGYPGGCG